LCYSRGEAEKLLNLKVEQIQELYKAYSLLHEERDKPLQAIYYARPLSHRLAWIALRLKVSANQITLSALAITIISGVLISSGNYIVGAALLNIGHLLDYADGTLAKVTGKVTLFGQYLDRTCDEIVETLIPISIGAGLYIGSCSFLGLPPIFYLILGFSYALLHLLGTISLLHIRLTTRPLSLPAGRSGHSISGFLYTLGVNIESSTLIILLPLTMIPNGVPLFLIGFSALALTRLVYIIGSQLICYKLTKRIEVQG
jgi:phosphatidylglycerophosphate synthase